jgi:transcriptional regulator with XRE-family HTH domain
VKIGGVDVAITEPPAGRAHAGGRTVRPDGAADARTAAHARRAQLGLFLRTRRERVTPQQVGLPPGLRRRTPGLRREEVAQLAGVGVTWYTWLEQGRPINASTHVLDAIARTLHLDRDEHDHLYRLADVPAVRAEGGAGAIELEPEVHAILDALPLMAMVTDDRFDVLAWNKPFAAMFPDIVDDSKYRNVLWFTFIKPGCCHQFVNRAEEMPYMAATLRAAYGRHIGEPAWERFVADLLAASPEFARHWSDHEVAGHATRNRVYFHPAVGQARFKSTSLELSSAPGARLSVLTPADEQSRAALQSLCDGTATYTSPLPCGHEFGMAWSQFVEPDSEEEL